MGRSMMSDTQRLRELDREISALRIRVKSSSKIIKRYRNDEPTLAEETQDKLNTLNSELSKVQHERRKLARAIKTSAGELKSHLLNASQKKDDYVRKINESSELKKRKISIVSGGLPGLGKKK